MIMKKLLRTVGALLVATLALVSCELPTLSAGLKQEAATADASARKLATSVVAPSKVYCTAAIAPSCFYFEFDIEGENKTARVLVPHEGTSYIQDGEVLRYKALEYPLSSFYYDPASQAMAGVTEAYKGVSYSFQGSFDPAAGFFGYITKIEGSTVTSGMLGGVPIYSGSNASNFVGEATYLFDTPTPQTLLFSAVVDADSGAVYGSWCESGIGWDFSIHGSIGGSADAKAVHITAIPLPAFETYIPGMTAKGEATFKNPAKKDISGTFDITYQGDLLPSLMTATKESL